MGLGRRIDEMLRAERNIQEVRQFLDKIYNQSGRAAELASLSDDEVMQLAQNLRRGVPFATPVFDGAAEAELNAMLDLAYPDQVARDLKL
ncbi:hypothetical protein, partial [Mammaliicoccus sciuri]|uniref:hypothetical protein n=1 Tax=Mammaliicoccus sciuri TaxID=1296 RepID=UPI00195D7C82